MELALNEVGLDEAMIANNLKEIMMTAVTATPKGVIIDDYWTRLEAMKLRHKFKKKWPDTVIGVQIFWNWMGGL